MRSRVVAVLAAGGLAVVLVGGIAAAPASAQQVALDTVESRLGRGEYDAARDALDAWWRESEGGSAVSGRSRARALLLRASLAPDLETAEPDYLAVILGYPTTPYAADAMLRLGQGLVIDGRSARALDYLERFQTDFPDHGDADAGLLWLVRAYRTAGEPRPACSAAREYEPTATSEASLRPLIEREARAACDAAETAVAAEGARIDSAPADDAPPERRAAEADRPAPAADTATADARPDTANASGRFTVQTGAFRREQGAETIADRLRRAGYQPRLVFVPNSSLLRVRVGRFERLEQANDLARRIQADGFSVAVVRDAHRERER